MALIILKFFFFLVFVILFILTGIYFLLPEVTSNFLLGVERSRAGFKQRSIEVGGVPMAYLEGGRGDTLVLLHGFSADKDNWTRMGRYLTPHFRVIAPDLPGFGDSGLTPDGDYSIDTQIDRLRKFLAMLGVQSLHLGGSSMGGGIAGAFAARYPNDLKSLLLVAPGGVGAAHPSEMFRLLDKDKPNPLIAGNGEEYEHLLDFVFVKRPFIPYPVKKSLVRKAAARQPLYQKIFRQILDPGDGSLEDVMTGLPVPTMIVWGARDRVLHVSGAQILGSVMPAAKVVVMDSVGHLPLVEKPKETAVLYLRFLGIKN